MGWPAIKGGSGTSIIPPGSVAQVTAFSVRGQLVEAYLRHLNRLAFRLFPNYRDCESTCLRTKALAMKDATFSAYFIFPS